MASIMGEKNSSDINLEEAAVTELSCKRIMPLEAQHFEAPSHSHSWEHLLFLNRLFVFLFISIYPWWNPLPWDINAWNQGPSEPQTLGLALLNTFCPIWAHHFPFNCLPTSISQGITFCLPPFHLHPLFGLFTCLLLVSFSQTLTIVSELPFECIFKFFS